MMEKLCRVMRQVDFSAPPRVGPFPISQSFTRHSPGVGIVPKNVRRNPVGLLVRSFNSYSLCVSTHNLVDAIPRQWPLSTRAEDEALRFAADAVVVQKLLQQRSGFFPKATNAPFAALSL